MNNEALFFEKMKLFGTFKMPRWSELPEIELYMDQVISVADKYLGALSSSSDPVLTPSMINNYVKNHILPPPVKKKYSREHLAKLMVICVLKPVMEISAIADVINLSEKLFGTARMLDDFSAMFEERLCALSKSAAALFENAENTEELLCAVATENAVSAVTEKLVVAYACAAFRAVEPEKKGEKKKEDKKE